MKTKFSSAALIPLIMIISFKSYLLPQEQEKKSLETIAVYNFKSLNEKEKYYSIIIPESLSSSVNVSGTYKINRVNSEAGIINKPSKENLPASRETFIIVGECGVVTTADAKKKLSVRIQIIDLRNMNSQTVFNESEEIGALLQTTIDRLSFEIRKNLNLLSIAHLNSMKASPYIAAYSTMKNIAFGTDFGYQYFSGSWADIYNDGKFVKTYLMFGGEKFALSMGYDYISANNYGKSGSTEQILMYMHTGSAALHYSPFYSNHYRLDFTAGIGGAYTYTRIDAIFNPDPFSKPLADMKSYDPVLEGGFSFSVIIDPLVLKIGTGYRRVIYEGTDQGSILLHFGAGYKI